MTPNENIRLIHKSMFEGLDIESQKNDFKNWKHMQKEMKIRKDHAQFIEGAVRLALNKYSAAIEKSGK